MCVLDTRGKYIIRMKEPTDTIHDWIQLLHKPSLGNPTFILYCRYIILDLVYDNSLVNVHLLCPLKSYRSMAFLLFSKQKRWATRYIISVMKDHDPLACCCCNLFLNMVTRPLGYIVAVCACIINVRKRWTVK